MAHETARRSPGATPTQSVSAWQQLSADGAPRTLIARLRAAGFPENVVRRIVGTLVHQQFEDRRHRIDPGFIGYDFKRPWPNSWNDPKIGPELRKIDEEERVTMREVLGRDVADSEEDQAMRQYRWGNLSEEKIQRISDYEQSWNEKQRQIVAGNGQLVPSETEKLVALYRSMREGLTEFLTPAEANEYLLRNSRSANILKYVLGPVHPTEQEYRAIYTAYQSYSEQFPTHPFLGNLDKVPSDQAAAVKAGADALIAQLNTALPPDRAADVQLALDPQFSQLGRLVNRLDLPMSAAKQVYDVQQSTLQQAKVINADMSLTTDTRNAQLTTLQQEATATIGKALGGKRGLNAYKQFGGAWLSTLVPKPGKG
jgi:hypothetical protein